MPEAYQGEIGPDGDRRPMVIAVSRPRVGGCVSRTVIRCAEPAPAVDSAASGERPRSPAAAAAMSAATHRFLSALAEAAQMDGDGRVQPAGGWRIGGRLDALGMDGIHRMRVEMRTPQMQTYQVTIDGRVYEVTVEEIRKASPPPGAPRAAKRPKPAGTAAAGTRAGERPIRAPMPGKILAVNAVQGDTVTADTVVAILEAMKMENDILAPAEGTVKSVHVQPGDTVNTGDLMVVIE